MTATSFDDLKRHKGHRFEVVFYGKTSDKDNVALECIKCNEVILDFDKEAKQ